jgi:serine/threonine-protein phosphatase PGAM5
LIRHGAYDRDTTVTDDRIGNGLNALGHEQAHLVGARIAQLPVKLHSLVSSDFTRARETADDIGALVGLAPVRDSVLHECTPTADRPDYMNNHSRDDVALCEANLEAAWAKYFTPTPDADRHDVLVCHGNVIRWLVARSLGQDATQWTHMDIANGSLTVIAVRADGGTRLVMFSDVGHLPVEKQTWSGVGGGWGKR